MKNGLGLLICCVAVNGCAPSSAQTQSFKVLGVHEVRQGEVGRYVFHIDPTTSVNALGGGYLLDSATGDLWTLGVEYKNGRIGAHVLLPIERPERKYYDIDGNPITKPTAEDLIKKYGK